MGKTEYKINVIKQNRGENTRWKARVVGKHCSATGDSVSGALRTLADRDETRPEGQLGLGDLIERE